MSRIVAALVDDDVDTGSLADVVLNVAEKPVAEWAEINGWSAELFDATVTLNVEAE